MISLRDIAPQGTQSLMVEVFAVENSQTEHDSLSGSGSMRGLKLHSLGIADSVNVIWLNERHYSFIHILT